MAELRAYDPSLRDKIAWGLAGAARQFGAGRYVQQDIADKAGGLIDFVPILGDMLAADQAVSDVRDGDYLGAALEASTWFPMVGDIAGKVGKGLRARYRTPLNHAVDWSKDINRIKLTPDRIEAAKAYMRDPLAASYGEDFAKARRGEKPAMPPHIDQAMEFARAMVRQGEKVRFKVPGDSSSRYVRVGDRGTVRFADHPQPIDHTGAAVGGFSRELRRRHHPAAYSVSPQEQTLDEVLGLFGYRGE